MNMNLENLSHKELLHFLDTYNDYIQEFFDYDHSGTPVSVYEYFDYEYQVILEEDNKSELED